MDFRAGRSRIEPGRFREISKRASPNSPGGDRIPVVGAGRTDAGVHAAGQVAHFDLPVAIPVDVLPRLLNDSLACDLRVRSAIRAAHRLPRDQHPPSVSTMSIASYGANPSSRGSDSGRPCSGCPQSRNDALNACAVSLPGRGNWASFTVPEAARRTSVRTIHRTDVVWRRSGLELHFFGDGFLRYQVRRMVGALLEVGRGRMTVGAFNTLLDSPTPGAPIPTAPARGLTLERVYYRSSAQAGFSHTRKAPGGQLIAMVDCAPSRTT